MVDTNNADKKLELLKKEYKLGDAEESGDFERKLRKMVKRENIVEVFERDDGSLAIQPVAVMDKALFVSMIVNAVLFVLFVTKFIELW